MIPERIETLKNMHLLTDLKANVELVIPSGAEWKPAADRLQTLLRNGAGRNIPVTTGEKASIQTLNDRHWVVLGSAIANPALMALYRRKYAFVDDAYPGDDGFVLQTVHNPEGRGHNILIVGASRPDGAGAALDHLEKILEETDGHPGYISIANSAHHADMRPGRKDGPDVRLPHPEGRTVPPDTAPARFREQTEAAFRGNAGRWPIEHGISLGLVHHFTHDPACAQMFRDVLFYYEDLVKNRYKGEWCFEHMLFIYAWTWRLFYVWDLIEESDAFTDPERLRMTNLLWGLANYVGALPYFRGETPPPPEIRQNHATFAALSMSFAAGYFKTYYGIDAFSKHLRFCDAIFDGQAGCYKPNDDGGGGTYCWLVPNHQMTYDLKRDDFRFLEGGPLRDIADFAILMTDNLGSPVDFGDMGTYSVPRKISPGIASILCKAAWYYNDGSYLWALDWMGGKPHVEYFYKDLPRKRPDRMAGITTAPFPRPLYEWVERHSPDGANIPPEEAFDKLVLRRGFDPDDEFLFLDGTATFAHGHEDGNSIERLTWKGRMWLAETDYIWKRPRHHTSVVSICNGESARMPALTALKWAEDFGETAFTRTLVPAYNGVNWTRDILWSKGRYFLISDTLDLLGDADYDLRCLWRTLGDVQLKDRDLTVEQQGVFFRIRNADDSEITLETECPRIAGQDPYRGYEFANGPIRIFKQRKPLHGQPGRKERYFNLLIAGTRVEIDARRIVRIGESLVRVEGPEGSTLFGAPGGETRIEGLRLTADAFALTSGALTLLNATALFAGDASFESDRPVHLAVSPADGRAELRIKEETAIRTRNIPGIALEGHPTQGDEHAATLRPGTYRLTLAPFPLVDLDTALRFDTPYTHRREPKTNRPEPGSGSPLRTLWQATADAPITCLHAQGDVLAVGTDAGRVALLDANGRIRWTHETGAEVRTVRLTDHDCLLTGGRDCALTLLNDDGSVRWKRDFIPSHGRDQIVNAIRIADLTGDGIPEIVVATDGWLVWALTSAGEEIWQRQIEHHAAQTLVLGDVEGDGKQEILVGTEYHTSNMLEADGRIRWRVGGGPCFTALALVDINGDGRMESFYGAMDGNLYALDSVTGKTRWTANLGDDVRHGFALDHAGFIAGSESGNIARLAPDGGKRWRRDLDAPITGLVPLAGNIVAGTADGRIVHLSPNGEILTTHQLNAGVTALAESTALIVGTADGRIVALA